MSPVVVINTSWRSSSEVGDAASAAPASMGEVVRTERPIALQRRSYPRGGMTTGGSKGPSGTPSNAEHLAKLAETQRGEAKQAGPDVPRPLRGKGRRQEPKTPPGP